jgi:hypothetical protein
MAALKNLFPDIKYIFQDSHFPVGVRNGYLHNTKITATRLQSVSICH